MASFNKSSGGKRCVQYRSKPSSICNCRQSIPRDLCLIRILINRILMTHCFWSLRRPRHRQKAVRVRDEISSNSVAPRWGPENKNIKHHCDFLCLPRSLARVFSVFNVVHNDGNVGEKTTFRGAISINSCRFRIGYDSTISFLGFHFKK